MQAQVAVNAVIFIIKNQKLLVYLDGREKEPFKNKLELPGGLLIDQETAEETLKRKLGSVFKSKDLKFKQFYTFTKPDRDPRNRVVSIGFVAIVNQEIISNYNSFYEISKLNNLAFDHKEIINKAVEILKNNPSLEELTQFLPKHFTLNELQNIYEIIAGKKEDNRNFRKKILGLGKIIPIGKTQKLVSHRPAKLYKFE